MRPPRISAASFLPSLREIDVAGWAARHSKHGRRAMDDDRLPLRRPHSDGKELQSSVVPFPAPPQGALGKLQWLHKGSEFAHGEKVKLKVPAEGLDGRSVRFVVQ